MAHWYDPYIRHLRFPFCDVDWYGKAGRVDDCHMSQFISDIHYYIPSILILDPYHAEIYLQLMQTNDVLVLTRQLWKEEV